MTTDKKARLWASSEQLAAHRPEKLITYRVSVLAQVLSRLVDVSVRNTLEITSRQWRVLVSLNRLGSSTSGEVARMANYDHSQVSRVAFELMEKGLIVQNNDASDRRKRLLELTPKGIECLRAGLPGSLERETRLRSRLSAADYDSFCRALKALEDEARSLIGDAGGAAGED